MLLTNREIIAALEQGLTSEAISQSLGRVLWVPAAWEFLRHSEQLDLEALGGGFGPRLLSSIAISGQPESKLPASLSQADEDRLEEIWNAGPLRSDYDLRDTALLAVGILRRAHADTELPPFGALALTNAWNSALALAWPEMPAPGGILADLLEAGAFPLATLVLLSNVEAEAAGKAVVSSSPDRSLAMLKYLATTPEIDLRDSVADAISQSPQNSFGGRILPALLSKAVRGEGAQSLLEQAWDRAASEAAEIADLMAQIARQEADPILELEAAQQAFEKYPSPIRQAKLALALTNLGKHQEALELEISDEIWEQQAAAAKAHLGMHQRAQCELRLESAVRLMAEPSGADYLWASELAEVALMAGRTDLALTATESAIARHPSRADLRLSYAKLLLESGDPHESAEQLSLADALRPDDVETVRLLAISSDRAGDAGPAIRHWQSLIEKGVDCEEELVEAALRHRDVELAQKSLAKVVARDPESAQVRILQARADLARGAQERAFAVLGELQREEPQAAVVLSQALMEQGQGEEALAVLSEAGQAHPDSAALQRALGRVTAALGDHQQAAVHLRAAHAAHPSDADLLIELGQVLESSGDPEEAKGLYERAIQRIPRSWRALAKRARIQSTRANWEAVGQALPLPSSDSDLDRLSELCAISAEAALHTADKLIAEKGLAILGTARNQGLDPQKHDLWSAMMHEGVGELESAIDLYQSTLKTIPEDQSSEAQQATMGLARSALASDQVALALSTLERAKEQFPNSWSIQKLLTTAYLSANLPDRAIDCAQELIENSEDQAEAKRLLGQALTAASHHEEAMQVYEDVAANESTEPGNWLDAAESAARAGHDSSLRASLAKALSSGRSHVGTLLRAASLQQTMGRAKSALVSMQAAADLEPDNLELLAQLATSCKREGEIQRAHKAWMRIVRHDASDIDAKHAAAEAALALGRDADAIALWEQVVSGNPSDVRAQRALAKTYCQVGEISKGMQAYEQASAHSPEDHPLALEAGLAALRAGHLTDALAHLSRARQLNPTHVATSLALADCLAELGRWTELLEQLELQEAEEGHSSALRCHAFLGLGEIERGEQAFAHAKQHEITSESHAVWQARAALKLGHWNEILSPLAEFRGTASAEREWLGMSVLLHQLRWVLQNADVSANLPAVDFRPQEAIERLRAPESEIGFLARRLQVAAAEVPAGELEDLLLIAKEAESQTAAEEFAAAYLRSGKAKEALLMANARRARSDLGSVIAGMSNEKLARYDSALDDYSQAIASPALHPLVHYLLGRCYLALDDASQATYHLQTAVSAWPAEPAWQHQLARMYMQSGALEGAIAHLQRAVDAAPDHAQYNLDLARAYRQANQQAKAEGAYQRALEGHPDEGEIHKEAAQLSLQIGNYPAAAKWFDRASTLLPSDAECLTGGARALLGMRRTAEAAEWMHAAKRLAPEDPEVTLGEAEICAAQGQVEQALRLLEKLDSNVRAVSRVKNEVLIRAGRVDEAIEGLQETVSDDPTDDEAWHSLALAHERKGMLEEATSASKAAVKLSPENSEYSLTYGRLCRASGQLDQALDFLTRAKKISPQDWRIEYQLGKVYEERRDLDLALQAYKRTSEMDPSNARAFYRSGLILRSMKSYDRAGQMLRKSVELNPEDREALHQLAAVRALELVHGGVSSVRTSQ